MVADRPKKEAAARRHAGRRRHGRRHGRYGLLKSALHLEMQKGPASNHRGFFASDQSTGTNQMKKKLYLNGAFVCEYKSTGDNAKDVVLCRDILKKKGLHKEVTELQAIFRQAYSFCKVAARLYADLNSSPSHGLFMAPFIVNSTFSVELYLKTLGAISGEKFTGHELTKLFDQLPENLKTAIKSGVPAAAAKWGLPMNTNFRDCLVELNGAFVQWRYAHESPNSSELKVAPLILVMEVLHQVCRESGNMEV